MRRFVGREAPLAAFETLLTAPDWPVRILCVRGPAGVGKTALMMRFQDLAAERGYPVPWVDLRQVEPKDEALVATLRRALGASPRHVFDPQLAQLQQRRWVLFLDHDEALAGRTDWVLRELVPQLPETCLLVIGSRRGAHALASRLGPELLGNVQHLVLESFSDTESARFLAQLGLTPEQSERVQAEAHGLPAALALLGEAERHREPGLSAPGRPAEEADALLRVLLGGAACAPHCRTLHAAAIAPRLTEDLLVSLHQGDREKAHAGLEWLSAFGLVATTPEGLVPHPVVRSTILREASWRLPAEVRELETQLIDYHLARLRAPGTVGSRTLVRDLLHLLRERPRVRVSLDLEALERLRVEPARAEDHPALGRLWLQEEGPAAAARMERRLSRHPERVWVMRDRLGEVEAAFVALRLDLATAAAAHEDEPAARQVLPWLEQSRALVNGKGAMLVSTWVVRDARRRSAARTALAVHLLEGAFFRTDTAVTFAVVGDPEEWREQNLVDPHLQRMPGRGFEVDGHRRHVLLRDWREHTPRRSLEALCLDEPPAAPQRALDRASFQAAVREALAALDDVLVLRANPLLHSRRVEQAVGPGTTTQARVAALQQHLRGLLGELERSPTHRRAWEIVSRTFLSGPTTQELASEALDLPFSTYRRHLARALQLLADRAWEEEQQA